ncbi:MAG: MBL fold metallo-hydrolase [Syntrophobacteraceae bacterium]|nr:MBL fold metallo-hydrolase [Syntrophobacteraceae bacterium]
MKIEQIPVGSMQVFCYLVYDEEKKEAILIDPAGNEKELVEHLRQKGLKLRYIVNTHGHADHTCGNSPIREATGARVVMHGEDDSFFLKPESLMFARSMGFADAGPTDVRVKDGDELSFGDLTMKFIHTPGHTPGACCILIDGNLFTGDTLFVGAVGRTDFPGGSYEQLIRSLQELVRTLPPDTVVWPGHDYGDRPRSTLQHEARTNPYIVEFME